MVVSLTKITQAISKVKALALDSKTVPGILLKLNMNSLQVCFSDGKRTMAENIETISEQGDLSGDLIVSYSRLVDAIDICQPADGIEVRELHLEFMANNVIKIKADKTMGGYSQGEGEDFEDKVILVSSFEQKISWEPGNTSNIKYAILTRADYADVMSIGDDVTTFEKSKLRDVLSNVLGEKGRSTYISSQNSSAFVLNLAYTTVLNVEEEIKASVCFSSGNSKALIDILSKMSDECVNVLYEVKDNRYFKMVSDDGMFGIMVEMSVPVKTELMNLNHYQSILYNTYSLLFPRAPLKNLISCALASEKNEKVNITFSVKDDGNGNDTVAMTIHTVNSGASVDNSLFVLPRKVVDSLENTEGSLENIKIPVALRVVSDMLSKCKESYVCFDIASNADLGTVLRIGDLTLDSVQQIGAAPDSKEVYDSRVYKSIHYTTCSRS